MWFSSSVNHFPGPKNGAEPNRVLEKKKKKTLPVKVTVLLLALIVRFMFFFFSSVLIFSSVRMFSPQVKVLTKPNEGTEIFAFLTAIVLKLV